jgi:cytochrome c oxidase subunit II
MVSVSFFRKAILPLSLTACLLLAGCSVFTDAPQTTFDPRGPVAEQQLDLFMLSLWVITFIFVSVGSVLLYVVLRFRRRPGEPDRAIPAHAHGNPLIEISLIVASVGLLLILAVPTYNVAIFSYDVPPEMEGDVLEVTATGYQWWWGFEYPELGIVTANEMTIPTGRPVRIHLRSQDVVHSFWVPKLGGKRDMIPLRHNFLWLKASEAGEYHGQCAEFCGTSHANMLFRVFALEEDDFNRWVERHQQPAREPEEELALEGRNLFRTRGCVQCHNVAGVEPGGVLGPDLTHFGARTTIAAALLPKTEEYLTLWLRDPERVKPGNLMTEAIMEQNLTDEEIRRLVAFLMSLD